MVEIAAGVEVTSTFSKYFHTLSSREAARGASERVRKVIEPQTTPLLGVKSGECCTHLTVLHTLPTRIDSDDYCVMMTVQREAGQQWRTGREVCVNGGDAMRRLVIMTAVALMLCWVSCSVYYDYRIDLESAERPPFSPSMKLVEKQAGSYTALLRGGWCECEGARSSG